MDVWLCLSECAFWGLMRNKFLTMKVGPKSVGALLYSGHNSLSLLLHAIVPVQTRSPAVITSNDQELDLECIWFKLCLPSFVIGSFSCAKQENSRFRSLGKVVLMIVWKHGQMLEESWGLRGEIERDTQKDTLLWVRNHLTKAQFRAFTYLKDI